MFPITSMQCSPGLALCQFHSNHMYIGWNIRFLFVRLLWRNDWYDKVICAPLFLIWHSALGRIGNRQNNIWSKCASFSDLHHTAHPGRPFAYPHLDSCPDCWINLLMHLGFRTAGLKKDIRFVHEKVRVSAHRFSLHWIWWVLKCAFRSFF